MHSVSVHLSIKCSDFGVDDLGDLDFRTISTRMSDHDPAFRRTAALLTIAGAIPFAGLAIGVAVLDPPTNATAGLWLQTYSAVILSFLGGIRWGLTLARSDSNSGALALSVLPALAGWMILPMAIILRPDPAWYLAYAGLFAVQLLWDWSSSSVPSWFKPVRAGVSAIVMASLVFAWAARAFIS